LCGLKTREHKEANRRANALKRAGRVESIHAGHGEIEYDEIRLKAMSFVDGFMPVACLAAYDTAGILLKNNAQCPTNRRGIINEKNRKWQGSRLSRPWQANNRSEATSHQVDGRRKEGRTV